jgi:hypothetical protein
VGAALIALVSQGDQACRLQLSQHTQIHPAFLSCPGPAAPRTPHRTTPSGLAMSCRFIPCWSRTAGPRRPGRSGSASRPRRRRRTRPPSRPELPLAASAPGPASRATVSFTYRQGVEIPTSNPAATSANVSPCAGRRGPGEPAAQGSASATRADRDPAPADDPGYEGEGRDENGGAAR